MSFQALFARIENPVSVYQNIKDTELRNAFVQHIKLFVPEWSDVYIKLLPYARSMKMIDDLKNAQLRTKAQENGMDVVEDYKDHREAFIWLVKDLRNEPWFAELGIVREKIMLTLLHILDITFKEMDNHKDTTENKKVNKLVQSILFKDKYLENFLLESTPETVERVYALLMDIKEIDPSIKIDIKHKISEKFPKLHYFGEEEKLTVLSRGLMVTAEKYEEKQSCCRR